MNLFFTEKKAIPTAIDLLRYSTPLGILNFDVSFFKRTLLKNAPQETLSIEKNVYTAAWEFPECQVEFLRLNYIPWLPEEMKVDQLVCGLWRCKNFASQSTIHFDCYLEKTNPKGIPAIPEFAEGLIARSWENQLNKLTIGTDSEEYLTEKAYLQKIQRRPAEIRGLRTESVSYLEKGLRITFSQLSEGDYIQVYFAAAWSNKDERGDAPLHAVNQSPEQIMQICDIY